MMKKKMRVLAVLTAGLMLVSCTGCSLVSSGNDNESKSSSSEASSSIAQSEPDYSTQINKALDYYRNTISGDKSFTGGNYWHASFLAATGTLEDKTLTFVLPKFTAGSFSAKSQASDYANAIISLIMMGQDPKTAISGLNLVSTLASKQAASGAFPCISDGGEQDSIDSTVFSMIALNMAGGAYKADAAATFLKGRLKTDNGLNDYGDTGNVDSTAAAVIATAKMTSENAKYVLNACMKFLISAYNKNGYFAGKGANDQENASSQAMAIMALIAAGENIYSDKWLTADGKNMMEVLLSNQDENGGFWYNISYKEKPSAYFTAPDDLTTSEALFAVACAQADRMLWYSYSVS